MTGLDADGHQGPDRGDTNCAGNNSSDACKGHTVQDGLNQQNALEKLKAAAEKAKAAYDEAKKIVENKSWAKAALEDKKRLELASDPIVPQNMDPDLIQARYNFELLEAEQGLIGLGIDILKKADTAGTPGNVFGKNRKHSHQRKRWIIKRQFQRFNKRGPKPSSYEVHGCLENACGNLGGRWKSTEAITATQSRSLTFYEAQAAVSIGNV